MTRNNPYRTRFVQSNLFSTILRTRFARSNLFLTTLRTRFSRYNLVSSTLSSTSSCALFSVSDIVIVCAANSPTSTMSDCFPSPAVINKRQCPIEFPSVNYDVVFLDLCLRILRSEIER
uniref:Uncharacterized protein n=1 Tax=Cacopsylla melanoneura TaxID=428564 RepID=A0A8D9EUE1_9HEMI